VPIGILFILLTCFGVNSLIGLSSVGFPASVAVLIVLFFALIIIDLIVGDRKTRALVSIIDVPVGKTAFCVGTLSNYILRLDLLFDI
jgi:hypothetical protein